MHSTVSEALLKTTPGAYRESLRETVRAKADLLLAEDVPAQRLN